MLQMMMCFISINKVKYGYRLLKTFRRIGQIPKSNSPPLPLIIYNSLTCLLIIKIPLNRAPISLMFRLHLRFVYFFYSSFGSTSYVKIHCTFFKKQPV